MKRWHISWLGNNKDKFYRRRKVYEIILHGIEVRMNERILVGNVGAMRNNDEAS